MPYATFPEVAAEVKGVKQLKALLEGHAEDIAADDDDEHPFFDAQSVVAQQLVDAALERAGYASPLEEPLTDLALRRAFAAIVVGLITQTDDNRQAWVNEFEKWGLDYINRIAEGTQPVIGAEVDEDDSFAAVFGTHVDEPVFDLGDPYATAHSVFADLTTRRRW